MQTDSAQWRRDDKQIFQVSGEGVNDDTTDTTLSRLPWWAKPCAKPLGFSWVCVVIALIGLIFMINLIPAHKTEKQRAPP